MVSPEKRTKQITLGKWDEARRKDGKEGLKRKPTRENLACQPETKKESNGVIEQAVEGKTRAQY